MKELIEVSEIQEQIIAFASGDFSRRLPISENMDSRDSIIAGINMLGEELEATTISRDYFESVYNAVSDLLLVTDDHFKIVRANKIACEKLGRLEDELIGIDPRSFIKIHPKFQQDLSESADHQKSSIFETTISPQPGKDFVLRCTINELFNKQGKNSGYLIIGTDITFEKQTEQKTLGLILAAQEDERLRLSNDLHDSLGQELNAVMMYIQTLKGMDQSNREFERSYEECIETLKKAIEDIRVISFDLMPRALEEKNLELAMIELCLRTRRIKPIIHNLTNHPTGLSKITEKVVYRIVQEFFTNSIRHAPEAAMQVIVYRGDKRIHFELSDCGPGFEIEKLKRKNGLKNINTRLEALDAEYAWSISPGTKLTFSLSYEKN